MIKTLKLRVSKLVNSVFKLGITKFLEKGDSEDIKKDPKFDIYRDLMNEKNLPYDQELYVINNRDKQASK